MEKFCLKWNDFESNVSSSFSKLRKEEDFYDVTLVSDDHVQMSSHKLVLSSSSEFFKTILRKSIHPNPLIYLTGVNSKELNFVMDYIYNGEVQIFHEELNDFLNIAQKLQINGLISSDPPDQHVQGIQKLQDDSFPKIEPENEDNVSDEIVTEVTQYVEENEKKEINTQHKSYTLSTLNMEAKEAVDKLVIKKSLNNYECKSCGKICASSNNMRKHVEIHIEGLSFECNICGSTFSTRMSLNNHRKKH